MQKLGEGMRPMRNKKKYTILFFLLILIISLTYYSIFNETNYKLLFESIKSIKIRYMFLCLIIVLLYFIAQGLYMKIVLKVLHKNISLKKGTFYSMIEFYFSGITPSSTGGQPVELYYMTKDSIPIRKSYITLLLNTIYFKLILLILGVFAIILKPEYIFNYSSIYMIFFVLGFIVDIIMCIICYMLIFKQKYVKRILKWIIKVGSKTKIFREKVKKINVSEVLKDYKEELVYIRSKKISMLISFIITLIQRILLFSVAYIVYRSLGFSKFSYLDLLMIQVSVQIAAEALPIPGGTGLSETVYQTIFVTVFGLAFADIGMLLTRTFTFYIPILMTGLLVLIIFLKNKKK